MHRVHAEACERKAAQVVREHAGRRVRGMFLSPDVVPRMHEQVVRQSTEPAGTRNVARWSDAVPNMPCCLLHARHIHGHVTLCCVHACVCRQMVILISGVSV